MYTEFSVYILFLSAINFSRFSHLVSRLHRVVIHFPHPIFHCDVPLSSSRIPVASEYFKCCPISTILDCSNRNESNWIPTHLNTSDLATKSTNAVNLSQTSTWLNRPKSESEWPKFTLPLFTEEETVMFIG